MPGKLRVGKYDYKTKKMPTLEGFENILVHTTGALSPYTMKDENDCIMENYWQFSKIWKKVYKIKQPISQWDNSVRWEWQEEEHLDSSNPPKILKEYYAWQLAGFSSTKWVRYPNGFNHHKEAVGSVYRGKIIGYIEARKKIYYRKYREIAIKTRMFKNLKARFEKGENIHIIEVDGPTKGASYPYNRVRNVNGLGTINITKKRLTALINNPDQAFGHGYCIAAMLLGIEKFD